MTFALAFPTIDPVAVEIGPVAIRWYALSYVVGLVLGWQYVRYLAGRCIDGLTKRHADDLLVFGTLGVVLGGRLGYVLFYQPGYYLYNPEEIRSARRCRSASSSAVSRISSTASYTAG